MGHEEALRSYVGAFVDELARAGVRNAVVCPGSRSTPLALLLEAHPEIRVWMHLDERSASFFALGMAKASGEPVAVVSTSGTAAANFLPAVVEARYGRVPLLVLTADRPHELRDVGAPQTIDQIQLYGHNVKWFADAALPETGEGAARYARTLADRAASTARAVPAGPVHLNFPFREPLLPAPDTEANRQHAPQVTVHEGTTVCDPGVLETLRLELTDVERGLVVCGPQADPALAGAISRLAVALGYPILADPLSGVRCGPHAEQVIAAYDAVLRNAEFASSTQPEVVLRFGAIPTSKPLTQYLERHRGARHILIDSAGWNDPISVAGEIVRAAPARLCDDLSRMIPPRERSIWLERWRRAETLTREAIDSYLAEIEEPFEGKVFAELAHVLPEGAALFAGSSMPVRDMDTFFPVLARRIRFMANRGANGIDGVVSSALGASTVTGPLVLVIGDLSFYHDMNGLLAARLHELDATIVLLNNDGGGIFNFLPQAGVPAFETLFGTPHGLDFRPAVEMYGGRFRRVTRWDDFRSAVGDGITSHGLSVIEVPTDRERNVELHRAAWGRVSAALAGLQQAVV